jgi:hypothetical protein
LFPATDSIGESGNIALQAARDWLADTSIDDQTGQTDIVEKVL